MTQLILVRHGVSLWNEEGRIQGHQDVPLSFEGYQQALAVAERLARIPFSAVYTSDLQRARLTAEEIARRKGLSPICLQDLRERFLGEWEGLSLQEVQEKYADLLALYRSDPVRYNPPRAETFLDLQKRVSQAIEKIAEDHPQETVVVVCHGGPIRVFIAWVLQMPLNLIRRLQIVKNCSITVVHYTGYAENLWVLERYNDAGHLLGEGEDIPRLG